MEFTENFNFRKPSQEDFYNIEDFNKNVDLIDMQLKKFEDTKLEADSDISKNIIKSLDNVSSEFPTITAGDTAKGALGKIKKFIDDFNKIRSALVMVGSIVDNSVTDRKDLAVSARQVMLLAQQNAALNNSLTPTAWQNLELLNGATEYLTGVPVRFRKTGAIVEIWGEIRFKGMNPDDPNVFATLPVGFRPAVHVKSICQGSFRDKWLLNLYTNGSLAAGRYGDYNHPTLDGNEWLPFYVLFVVA